MNNTHYKWRKLFASMRYNTDGNINLSPLEQQELLDDIQKLKDNDERDSTKRK